MARNTPNDTFASKMDPGSTEAPVSSVAPMPGWATMPLGVGAGPVVVKEGAAPLVYLAESGGTFRVHDGTERKDLARADVSGRTIIRVDARNGVVAGRETLLAGPLPADHRYVIYYDPQGPNYSRQGVFQPRPASRSPAAGANE
jgi:hypothetical protein